MKEKATSERYTPIKSTIGKPITHSLSKGHHTTSVVSVPTTAATSVPQATSQAEPTSAMGQTESEETC